MKKKIHSKNTLVFFLCLVLHFSPQAQIHKYFIITGKIISDYEIIESGTIQIVKKEQHVVTMEIPANGLFRVELDYNSNFNLIFSQKGYLSKTINVNPKFRRK